MKELTPEQYQAAQKALDYLQSYILESHAGMSYGPGTAEAMEELLDGEAENDYDLARNALGLALGMADIAVSLIKTRQNETQRALYATIADLRQAFTPPRHE
ncbi:hypothetical protein H7J77_01455 [Mycolicibacillus parakoreensis]|uniref:DUF1844 domain-containing protein n=1 Tax=Mycolicibacillus parakoreensis TaxID=1069221 RepID=A0ABY3U5Z9_9MYCO|nr:hypothetical protein [Mycolicibacillus parakoreensis]MCV7314216.1 hypothetical protein [Mycolicibacillus parakoreensis]ULN52932.1 hypothetical protein MIU77_00610 [Mycolicibacillus parakoreensis]HLR99544.1 hypothetical protein [Mycolicibacillus parakoreensis]